MISAFAFVRAICIALLALTLTGAHAIAQSQVTVVNQTTLFVDPILQGEAIYRTGDELATEVAFESTVRVTTITINYASPVPVNYVVRFYSGALVRAITIPNLPAGGGEFTYNLPEHEQFNWSPLVTTNVLGQRSSGGRWSVQFTALDGSDTGTLAGHRIANGTGFWLNLTDGRLEAGSTTGVVSFDTAQDIERDVGIFMRVTGTTVSTPAPATLASLTPGTASIRGGTSLTMTVTLSAPAPAGGVVVQLSSNNRVAVVPASVTVPEGSTTTTFVLLSSPVRRNTDVLIRATSQSVSRSAVITVRR